MKQEITIIPLTEIKRNPNNPRAIKDEAFVKLVKSLKDFPEMLDIRPIVVNKEMVVLGGNMRLKAAQELKIKSIPVIIARNLTAEQEREFVIKDNVSGGEWDWEMLLRDWNKEELSDWGLTPDQAWSNESDDLKGITQDEAKKKLSDRFIIPPFSIFDTRQGYWQDRRRAWVGLGIKSESGREKNITFAKSAQGSHIYELRNRMRKALEREPTWPEIEIKAKELGLHFNEGTSIFDPVLCEIIYRWFVPDNGTILDPFAGGSVRGLVASLLDLNYTGIDIRAEQIKANYKEAKEVLGKTAPLPTWINGDSQNIGSLVKNQEFDFVFSCPPYADLEVYSDLKNDISNMSYDDFADAYQRIIWNCLDKLKNDRFACFVVGDIRDKKGMYRSFVNETIDSFRFGGASLYNEIILVNVAGSLAIRAGRQFSKGRKVGKMHQNVLVFYKGDPKNISTNFPEIIINEEDEKKIDGSLGL